jgi:hypothetical protein
MDEFERRERYFEKEFELAQFRDFKARARRARLIADWVATRCGLEQREANAFALRLVHGLVDPDNEERLFSLVRKSLHTAGITDVSDHRIRTRMAEFLNEARVQVLEEA